MILIRKKDKKKIMGPRKIFLDKFRFVISGMRSLQTR